MNELAKKLMCIVLRNGIEIWIDEERAKTFQQVLSKTSLKFIDLDNQTINIADVTGVFTPQSMEDFKRRKNGERKCKAGNWHDKDMKCDCPDKADIERWNKRKLAYEQCGMCQAGFITVILNHHKVVKACECQKDIN